MRIKAPLLDQYKETFRVIPNHWVSNASECVSLALLLSRPDLGPIFSNPMQEVLVKIGGGHD